MRTGTSVEPATAAGYVECSDCGHPVERHIGGCDSEGCTCAPFTARQIATLRQQAGLPTRWQKGTI